MRRSYINIDEAFFISFTEKNIIHLLICYWNVWHMYQVLNVDKIILIAHIVITLWDYSKPN
jgi:hypothetical protein